ncbi:GNAT family N-acetyltransferase [Pseudodonghicola flavimaris]|uniref:GNAT family N-acetyltransferase n=1 Tax=Pseudodonghicola flavimaris TaxID=3050036 RepID=A0ABT7EXW6_9RHOB|nr:GNAT family N-acetyltransferase [Pseudodonghicola flavimaris]MDK3017197.1 GNAT family N-acetyltransferase [Pseudodonghicola flavimaris]
MSLFLRAARPLDAGRMGEILHRFQRETDWMPDHHTGAEAIAHCDAMIRMGWVTVAEYSGAVVGFLARHGEEICALYLAPGAQGSGVADLLMAEAKARSPRLWLRVIAANNRAHRFYLRAGFAEVARGDGAENDENLPDITMIWQQESGR